MDLLWRNPGTGQVAIWLMSGTALKQEVVLPQVVGGLWDLAGTGDFNNDGEIDLVWRDYQTGANGIWFMNGTSIAGLGSFDSQSNTDWKIVGIADINNDNKLDFIWHNDRTGGSGIWLMNGSSIMGLLGLDPVADTNWKIAGVADVNGDTHVDLVWRNEQTGASGVWMLNGNSVIAVSTLPGVADPNWKLDEVGDFNADGKVDLIWRNYASGITGAWLMNGTKILQTAIIQDGNSNNDVLLGDHGKVYSALPLWQNVFSIDTGAADGGAGDVMFGNQGDDLMMGQQGNDAMFGESGEDDMLGGHNVAGGADGSDLMDGGAQADVMLGDNGVILRRPLSYQLWQRYPSPFADVIRDVTRYDDRDRIGGNDTMMGGTEDDVMHGQRGDDLMYGNAGDDEMYGELGSDNMSGGAGVDTMLGDVGIITRAYNPDGTPRINQNGSWHRDVILTDVGGIIASGDAAGPTADLFQTADLLLATGTPGSQGTGLQVISLFEDGNDVMNGDDADDAMFGQRGNDTLSGGAGNDYMQGNAGDDQVNGDDGNDLLIGDDSNNLAAFNTEIPNVTRGLHLIERSAGVNINLGLDGVVVIPAANLVPKMTYGLLPTLTLAPQQFRDSSPVPVIGNLQTNDGVILQPLLSIVPNLVNHTDLLSGQDIVRGGAGRDMVVGDDFANVMPLRTGNAGIDPVLDQLTRQFYQLIYDLHDLELASVNAPAQTLTIGNDVVDGGDDSDSVFGDNNLFFGPFVQQSPSSTSDLGSLLAGLQSAIAAVSFGVNQLIPASSLGQKPITLSLGNDNVTGGNGDDFLYADDSMTIAPILNTLNYQRGTFWNYNLAGANRPARANFRDYDVQLGNDSVGGGDGNDLMVGGYSTIINPLVTVAASPTDTNLQRSLELLISDINTFVRDLHVDNHGILYDTRNQSNTLIAQNDNLWGESGNDLMVADNITLTTPFLNGQINTSLTLNKDYLDYSEEEHNFMHALQHQYDFAYRRANLGFTRMAEDFLSGGDGNDILFGLRAIDVMLGDLGNDFLSGGDDADQITDPGAGNTIRNTNPSPADRRDIINPTAQLMLSNSLSPAMQQYIQQLLQAQNSLALQGQFYANFPG
jgi:Ca2+-binding RTX toxin-like protein